MNNQFPETETDTAINNGGANHEDSEENCILVKEREPAARIPDIVEGFLNSIEQSHRDRQQDKKSPAPQPTHLVGKFKDAQRDLVCLILRQEIVADISNNFRFLILRFQKR